MIFVFSGFIYLAVFLYREQDNHGKGLWLMGFISVISALVIYYLIGNFILGFQGGESVFEIFLDYFYPIGSALILISTIFIYTSFRELDALGTPLLLLTLSAFSTFVADMLYTYYSWNDIYGIAGVLSDSIYAIDYLLSFAAFFMLSKLMKLKISATQ